MPIVAGHGGRVAVIIGAATVSAAVILGANIVIDPGGDPPVAASGCELPEYPDETCTGIPEGVTLTPHAGDLFITTDGQTVDGLDVTGCIFIDADNVTVRNTKVSCNSFGALLADDDQTGILIEDVDVSCLDTGGASGIGSVNMTVRRANIHNCENGMDVGYNVTVEDSYIHDLINEQDNPESHTDGVQVWDGNDVTFRHNRIDTEYGTSALNINNNPSYPGTVDNVLVEDNLLASAGAYTLYCSRVTENNYRVINNKFSTLYSDVDGVLGFSTDCDDITEGTGNTVYETGAPVTLA